MNGLVAAIKFLLETVVANAGGAVALTYQADGQAPAGTDLGSMTVGLGVLAGYYTLRIVSTAEVSATDDFWGCWHVTA
jgi:hypothetical protein